MTDSTRRFPFWNRVNGRPGLSRTVLLCTLLVGVATDARAQESRPQRLLRAGDRVWVSMPGWDVTELEGRLLLLEPGYVTVRRDSALRIPVTEITRFELHIGKNPVLMVGVPLAAAGVGAAVAPMLTTEPTRCLADLGDPACRGEVPDWVLGVFGGLILGGFLADALVPERWVAIALDRIAVGPGVIALRAIAF